MDPQQRDRKAPLIGKDAGPIFGALITAVASLLIYSFNQLKNIDERLDRLEQEARVLLDGAGGVRPSREAMDASYHVEDLRRRVDRLEGRID